MLYSAILLLEAVSCLLSLGRGKARKLRPIFGIIIIMMMMMMMLIPMIMINHGTLRAIQRKLVRTRKSETSFSAPVRLKFAS